MKHRDRLFLFALVLMLSNPPEGPAAKLAARLSGLVGVTLACYMLWKGEDA